ncbi:MAG TPA: hypothetical protein VNM34_04720 [Verrucomicrobiae bacterium]|nr:hypothetical protein [Verrucomicrobiae bacterium]
MDSITSVPCDRPGLSGGHVELVTDPYTGAAVVACALSIGNLTPDSLNNTLATASAVTMTCGSGRSFNGTTVPYGSSDWLKVTYTLTSGCTGLRIRFTNNVSQLARFDITDANGVLLNGDGHSVSGFQFDTTIASPNPVWVRVWAPYVGTIYTLSLEDQ